MSIDNVHQIYRDLKEEDYEISDFEALKIAVEMQRNQIIQAAFNVSSSDAHPSALEAIAIQLGYDKQFSQTIPEVLNTISEAIRKE